LSAEEERDLLPPFYSAFSMVRFVLFSLSLMLGAAGAVIAASDNPPAKADSSRSDSPKDPTSGDYVLQPQDLIRIQIFQEPDLNRELRISQEGKIELPLIRSVDLKNKTVREAEEIIRRLYDADYLVNPQVNLTVLEYAPRSVYVNGSVSNQGVIDFPKEGGLTLLAAISRAGGFTRLANRKAVTLKRTVGDDKSETYRIDVDELMKGSSTETWPLQPGDVITVPEKIL
jgi:polysaccharide export outer membrane protein